MEIIIAIVKLALLAAVVVGGLTVGAMVIGLAFLLHRVAFGQCKPGHQRGRWKWILVPLAILLLWFVTPAANRSGRRQPASVATQVQERTTADATKLRSAADKARQKAERQQKSMHELWEELNKPRIDLSNDQRHDAAGANRVAQQDMGLLGPATERLDGVAETVSTAARRMSDVGTLIGQVLVAMQRGDAPSPAPAAVAPSPGETGLAVAVAAEVAAPSPAPRPDWIDDPPKRVGNVWRQIIVAGDFATREECDREADRLLLEATANHLAELTGVPQYNENPLHVTLAPDAWVVRLRQMGLGLDYVRREIAKDEFEETVELSVGPMKRLYTLVEFSPSVDAELRQRWQRYLQEQRLAVVGVGAGSVLGLIGLAYGLLKVDTWTKGYYTKRLFLGVPAAIIGIILLLTWNEVIF